MSTSEIRSAEKDLSAAISEAAHLSAAIKSNKEQLEVWETRHRELLGNAWQKGIISKLRGKLKRLKLAEEDKSRPVIVWRNKPWMPEETLHVFVKETPKRVYYRRAGYDNIFFASKEDVDLPATLGTGRTVQPETSDSGT